jgi:hypothetical protein
MRMVLQSLLAVLFGHNGKVMSDAAAKGWADGEISAVVKKFRDAGAAVSK